MSNTLMVIAGCAGIISLILLGAYLKYKKVDASGILAKLKNFLEDAEGYTKSLEALATGKTQKALNQIELYEKLGQTGISYAGQLLLSGQIDDDENGTKRKQTALSYIYAFLQKEGITIDDNIKTIASGAVESGILSNKTIQQINEQLDKLIQEKVVSLQKEKDKIQAELQQVQEEKTKLLNENASLKAAITNAASTVESTTQATATPAQATPSTTGTVQQTA